MDRAPIITLMEDDIREVVGKYTLLLTVGEAIGVLQIAIMDIYRDSQEEDEL